MERLAVGPKDHYDSTEAAIHVGRYALAMPFAQGRRVLDAACGEGYGSWLLAAAGATAVTGIDNDEASIARARALFRHEALNYVTGDANRLDHNFPEHHFDLIVSIETIEHLDHPEVYLRAIRRVATDDAIIIITCPNDHWYYPGRDSNTAHRRKYLFAEFQNMTQDVLGSNVRWMIGSAALGFATAPWPPAPQKPVLSPVVDVTAMPSTLAVRPGERAPTPETCSYFIGIWNAGDAVQTGGGALAPLSMNAYSDMISNFSAFQELASLRSASDELRIARAQASALRREADLRFQNIQTLTHRVVELERALAAASATGTADTVPAVQLAHQMRHTQSLEADLAWHRERVASLDEALAWHVRRVQALETERDASLAEAAHWRRLRSCLARLLPSRLQGPARWIVRKALGRR